MFELINLTLWMPLAFAVVLLVILIVSFRSRAVVFCQYLETMTGVKLHPSDVRREFNAHGRNGVRELFLDLIIREDLKEGPIEIPDGGVEAPVVSERAEESPDRHAITGA